MSATEVAAPRRVADPATDEAEAAADAGAPEPVAVGELLLERVRRLARVRAAWLREIWSAAPPTAAVGGVSHGEADAALADADAPEAEAAWLAGRADLLEELAVARQLDEVLLGDGSRLAQLARTFDLDRFDIDLLSFAVAAALDPTIIRLCRYLQDDQRLSAPTAALVARVFRHGRGAPLSGESELRRWQFVLDGRRGSDGEVFDADPQIVRWLLGERELDAALRDVVVVGAVHVPLSGWPVAAGLEAVAQAIGGQPARPVRIQVIGPEGSGRRSFAASLAAVHGVPLLVVEADRIEDHQWVEQFSRIQRQAFLDGAAVAWAGSAAVVRPWPRAVPWFPLQFVASETTEAPARVDGVVDRALTLPEPTMDERAALWRASLPAADTWSDDEVRALAASRATPGEITAAARTSPVGPAQAVHAVRVAASAHLGDLAELLECPFEPEDLVVSDHIRAALDDLAFEASIRTELWESPPARRLYPTGRGLVALLCGPPGTGKTMAAQVLARRLGVDLYRINLATVISKYVGETAGNIDRVLRRASGREAVLLFDEADALYGKRTSDVADAQDRYVNMDTGHLMVAIENFDGVVVLASNQRDAIDPAFLRRMRSVIEFPRPDADQRARIWEATLRALTERPLGDGLAVAVERLAAQIDLSGAQIKYAALGALVNARRRESFLDLEDLLHGVDRELAKEARALSGREREAISGG